MEKVKVTIIGTGALGSTLALALSKNDIAVYSLYNRSRRSLPSLANQVAPKFIGTFPQNLEEIGNVIFITASDAQINRMSEKLALISDDFSGKTVAHCSGTKTTDCLSVLKTKGGSVASFHPVQTFTRKSKADDFQGIYFDIAGDEEAKEVLNKIAEALGAQTVEIEKNSKPFLHAAGVMASNYLLTLLNIATEIAEIGGIEKNQAQKMLVPLSRKTLENAGAGKEISEALSGPAARGDSETVEKHIHLLSQNPELQKLYKKLGVQTLKLAEQKGTLSNEQKSALKKLFE